MKTTSRRKPARRRTSPLPALLLLALLLFSAGLMVGWTGAYAVQIAAGKDLSAPDPVPGSSQLVEPPSTYPLEEPSPAPAGDGWALSPDQQESGAFHTAQNAPLCFIFGYA